MSLLRRIGWRAPADAGSIRTYPTGRLVNPLALQPADVRIDDVGHALARLNRFNGYTAFYYSVAQHAVLCSRWLDGSPLEQFYALHHDDGEAYLGDMPSPIKRSRVMRGYRRAADRAQAACYRAVGLDPDAVPPSVHAIDAKILRAEQLYLTLSPIEPLIEGEVVSLTHWRFHAWTPDEAQRAYLARHQELADILEAAPYDRAIPRGTVVELSQLARVAAR